jgi:hypothetical protein
MFSNSYYEAEAHREGATGFLLKSYELAEIVNLIHEAYRNPTARRLFPNIALRKDMALDAEKEGDSARGTHVRLVQAIRRMYRAARGETVG